MGVKVFTTVKNARRSRITTLGHTTVCVATNAAGGVGPPLFIHKGVYATSVPTAGSRTSLETFNGHNPSAYTTKELFEQYIVRFVDYLHIQQEGLGHRRPILLVVDGHCSRLNVDLLFHCTVNGVTVFELPIHLTHLLQPNDAVVNRYMKDVIRCKFQECIAALILPTRVQLACFVLEALLSDAMKNAIVVSWRHCGLWELDPTRAAYLIKDEVISSALGNDERVAFVIKQVEDTVKQHSEVVKTVTEQNQEAPRLRGRRLFFSQKRAKVLTSAEAMSQILLSNQWRDIKHMPVAALHEHVKKFHKHEDLVNLVKGKFHKRSILEDMEFRRLEGAFSDLCAAVELRIELYEAARLPSAQQLIEDFYQFSGPVENIEVTFESGSIA